MKILSRLRILTLILASFIVLGATAPASAIEGGGIGGRPANPDPNNPRTESIFIYTHEASSVKNDEVLIMNNTDQDQVIDVYAVDGILTNTGAYACEQAVEQKGSVGAWVNFPQSQVTLKANTSQRIPFTLSVPAGTDVGEHNGCIVFQSANDEGEVQGNVRVRTRQAIRMAVTVPGDLKKDVALQSFTMDKVNNLQQFMMTISNKGNVSADVNASVSLRTLWGVSVYENSGGYPVLANANLDLNYVNEETPFWGGWYVASAEIIYDSRPGTFNVVNSEFKISKTAPSIVVFAIPHPMAFALYWMVVDAGIIVAFFIIRRRKEQKEFNTWGEHKVSKNDTIIALAAKRGIDWRTLARANKIKSPYVLTPGTSIKLPELNQASVEKKTKQKNKKV